MNKTLLLVTLGLIVFVPSVTHAAFNFGSVSSDQIYLEQEQSAIVVKETRTNAVYDFNPPAGVTCESEAQQAGLSESNNYWCLQKADIGTIGYGTCVFLCQVGEGSGSLPSGPTPGTMTTYILSSPPVGHPLSYFNNASQSEQDAMYNTMMCLALPSFGSGCELKRHVPVTVAPTVTLAANPASVVRGSTSVLTWSSTNATSCTGTNFATGGATSGSVSTGALSATTNYSVSCTNAGGTATDSKTVTVQPLTTATLTRTPASIPSGSSATLTWGSTNANICVGNGFDTLGATSGTVSTGALNATTDYSVTCSGPSVGDTTGTWQADGTDISDLSCPITGATHVYSAVPNCPSNPNGKSCNTSTSNVCKINVVSNGANCVVNTLLYQCRGGGIIPGSSAIAHATVVVTAPPTVSLSAAPTSIVSGNSSTLSWQSANATSCSFNQGIGSVGTNGTRSVSPTATTLYTVTCTGAGGTATDSKTVTVTQASLPDLTAGAVTPASVVRNQAISLSASVSNMGAASAGASTASLWVRNSASTVVHSADISTAAIAAGGSTNVSSSYTFTAVGTYSARVCADTNTSWAGTLAESDENNNCGPWTDIVVTNTPQPDLVASAISPSTAQRGSSVTLSSTIQNQGATATGGSFTNLFQIDNDSDHNSVVTTRTDTSPNLTPSGTDSSQVSYTFGTEGMWYVRACADNDAAWASSVSELDETNNCGAWTTITVTVPPSPASVSCTVSSTNVLPGGSATYSANPANGASGPYTWVASDGASVGTGSTASRTFAAAGNYAMNVKASNTSVSYCPNVSVVANWCTTGSAALSITASPARVRSGQASTVTWSATNVIGQNASCTVSGPGVSWTSAVSASPVCSASGSATPIITTQSTYTLTCGAATDSVTVNVIPNFQEF